MKTDSDAALADRFAAIADHVDDSDWDEVVLRRGPLPTRARGLPRARRAALAMTLAAAAVVALVAPWDRSSGSLSDLALAAIGPGPVLHVVGDVPITEFKVFNIQSRASQPILSWQQETWYDHRRGLRHTITRSGASIVDDLLATPKGSYTPGGIVYDCAWVAAHPIAATKARVSCNASGSNGTKPHLVPRPLPTLNPGLVGFLDGYQQALRKGNAHLTGKARLDGRAVEWLEFKTDGGPERVALDTRTHKPLLVKDASGWSIRITTIETISSDEANFAHPTKHEIGAQPTFGRADNDQALRLDPSAISNAVHSSLWAGKTLSGLPLAGATREKLTASFAQGTPAPQTGIGLQLLYGALEASGRLNPTHPYVQISQAPNATLAFAYMWGFEHETPPTGQIYVENMGGTPSKGPHGKPIPPSPPRMLGFTVINGRYVTIQASSASLLLSAARNLRPAPGLGIPAHRSTARWITVLNDWLDNGRIDGSYSCSTTREAIRQFAKIHYRGTSSSLYLYEKAVCRTHP